MGKNPPKTVGKDRKTRFYPSSGPQDPVGFRRPEGVAVFFRDRDGQGDLKPCSRTTS